MKPFTFLLLLLACMPGCKYDTIFDEYGYHGEGESLKNGTAWTGKLQVTPNRTHNFCAPDTCIHIVISRYYTSGVRSDYLFMGFVPLKVGRHYFQYFWPPYNRHERQLGYGEFTTEGDVISGSYHGFKESPDNFVEITRYDPVSGFIDGIFQTAVVRDSFFTYPGAVPDTIRFTNGSFSGRVYWE